MGARRAARRKGPKKTSRVFFHKAERQEFIELLLAEPYGAVGRFLSMAAVAGAYAEGIGFEIAACTLVLPESEMAAFNEQLQAAAQKAGIAGNKRNKEFLEGFAVALREQFSLFQELRDRRSDNFFGRVEMFGAEVWPLLMTAMPHGKTDILIRAVMFQPDGATEAMPGICLQVDDLAAGMNLADARDLAQRLKSYSARGAPSYVGDFAQALEEAVAHSAMVNRVN